MDTEPALSSDLCPDRLAAAAGAAFRAAQCDANAPLARRRWAGVGLICGLLSALPLHGATDGLPAELRTDVTFLAETIGPRAVFRGDSLQQAADFIVAEFEQAGWTPRRLAYPVGNVRCENIEVERRGTMRPDEIVIVAAHYDTVPITPGADDNASGVAALLALARHFSAAQPAPARTLRFVAFANEEPIYFQTELMGSRVYARQCKQRGEKIVAMISLETLGYYSKTRGSQKYPVRVLGWFYPSRGDFVALVANRESKSLVKRAARSFRSGTTVRCVAAALPQKLNGIGWSDHWSFWQEGYPAIMVTDTAPFRNPHYHQPTDTPDTLDYETLALAVQGLKAVVRDLVKADSR